MYYHFDELKYCFSADYCGGRYSPAYFVRGIVTGKDINPPARYAREIQTIPTINWPHSLDSACSRTERDEPVMNP